MCPLDHPHTAVDHRSSIQGERPVIFVDMCGVSVQLKRATRHDQSVDVMVFTLVARTLELNGPPAAEDPQEIVSLVPLGAGEEQLVQIVFGAATSPEEMRVLQNEAQSEPHSGAVPSVATADFSINDTLEVVRKKSDVEQVGPVDTIATRELENSE